jgi:hypothetical protein
MKAFGGRFFTSGLGDVFVWGRYSIFRRLRIVEYQYRFLIVGIETSTNTNRWRLIPHCCRISLNYVLIQFMRRRYMDMKPLNKRKRGTR